MHPEILVEEQQKLLPLLKLFKKDYYLVGGTAIALQIGHRKSIDFDLFSFKPIKRKSIKENLQKNNFSISNVLFEDTIQLHLIINSVKVTFFNFPYQLHNFLEFEKHIKMPDLLTLSAMKAFALGGRGKWKDYVDMYFILKNFFSLKEISNKAKELFADSFNEKLFRQQLCFFQDISFEEKVEFLTEPVSEEAIKTFLTEIALQPLI